MPDDPGYSKRDERRDDNADVFPGDECWTLQKADMRRALEAQQTIDSPLCSHCGEEGEYAGIGRHRKYCSDRCRVAAYRARKRKVHAVPKVA
ncbi:hypothetical protein NE857_30550 [Nocardiopsis exhalans]|uniref:Uncharacterized protein n=2 Tax=Nocardiopsis TaxID=2013 RepID=A0A840WJG7_9ACTN|nr:MULTISPECIES: hypothetical protein [Nocardiopsis]MBB5493131.1 hypothetical protein [Nocardiopsis metallicus]USY19530.1 hypothetical protein NE857_30550 [Nocardiopsis exhalans]